jgi:hypothetical protein
MDPGANVNHECTAVDVVDAVQCRSIAAMSLRPTRYWKVRQ